MSTKRIKDGIKLLGILSVVICAISACVGQNAADGASGASILNVNTPNLGFTESIFSNADAQKIVNLMTSDTDLGAGLSYVASAGNLANTILPMSFYSTSSYWNYVCQINTESCIVTDSWDGSGFIAESNGAFQTERAIASYGTDIYDAATWQIAIAVAAANGLVVDPSLPSGETNLLTYGYDGNANYNGGYTVLGDNRGVNNPQQPSPIFTYNGIPGGDIKTEYGYMFRILGRSWITPDPFKWTHYAGLYITSDLESAPTWFVNDITGNPGGGGESGSVSGAYTTWNEYKPVTGENAWGWLIGPIQADYIADSGNVPSGALSVQNAKKVLANFAIMQSAIGAIYYAPESSTGNTGQPVNPYTASVENNASTLAGLMILESELKQQGYSESDATMTMIHRMIHGGTVTVPASAFESGTYASSGRTYITAGILSFLESYAFDQTAGIFEQEGHANDPSEAPEVWVPGADPNGNLKTVDVNTWTVSVLGVPFIDGQFGSGTAYNIWQHVKQFAGYCGSDNTLWGVGYSESDGNNGEIGTTCPAQSATTGVLSGEWTGGAINMLRVMIYQYGQESTAQAESYVTSLQQDLTSMESGIMNLRTDTYPSIATTFGGPSDYQDMMPILDNQLGFMYASKRYYIPFGWYANPLPSTASTSWMMMLNYGFNPFRLGGSYAANLSESGAEQ